MRQSLVTPIRLRPRRQPPWTVEEDVYLVLARLFLPDQSSLQMSRIINDCNCYGAEDRNDQRRHCTANSAQDRYDQHLRFRLDGPQRAAQRARELGTGSEVELISTRSPGFETTYEVDTPGFRSENSSGHSKEI